MNLEIIQNFNSQLIEKKLTIAFAESITAGLIASSIASISGSSSILRGSIVTYNVALKKELLKVKQKTLDKYSAESFETTVEMVNGLEKMNLKADIYVSITGVASCSVNDYKIIAPIGSVFIVIKYKGKNYKYDSIFYGGRNEVREQSVYFALAKTIEVVNKNKK
jgi:nicotinamide-nucleotide amidase